MLGIKHDNALNNNAPQVYSHAHHPSRSMWRGLVNTSYQTSS